MTLSTFIKMKGSIKDDITIEDIKQLINQYRQSISHTSEQLAWDYSKTAFPYVLKVTDEGKHNWFYLYSEEKDYHMIAIGVDYEYIQTPDENKQRVPYIQISLSQHSTIGDKSKANEFAKFLSKKLKGELHLFNGRIIHFNLKK
ncbi:DUF1885 family protein [Pradoshia sp. D12]|uniref:DUF1885 family protein n=1 Tax=Bacillaceae TaxID=186817 RepID=UPI00080AC701|nr:MULTISPECIES: DUF1885 family protein [Bacillaceae]OCA89760.1 hypothetical protein A8L44_02140 [Bacillus sp. FJAT-27986]QFK70843.1 DUF1885 family protein [Pradoshia sp. D12]TPF72635.1 DUF1885 family protein [Bacillus sp. D12]